MRKGIAALLLTLGLAMVLSLPAAAAEPASQSPLASSKPAAEPTAPTLDPQPAKPVRLADIFGTVPAPRQMSGLVDCFECGSGVNSAAWTCTRHCWRDYGWCVDQCYADADTCTLMNCICGPC